MADLPILKFKWTRAWQNLLNHMSVQRRCMCVEALGPWLPIQHQGKTAQTAQLCELIFVFVGRTWFYDFVGFLCSDSNVKCIRDSKWNFIYHWEHVGKLRLQTKTCSWNSGTDTEGIWWKLKDQFSIPEAHGPQWLTWVNSYKSLVQHFRLSVAMATNQTE